jgi:hypothetical protein
LSLSPDPVVGGGTALELEAASPGEWGNNLQVIVDHQTEDNNGVSSDVNLFNLNIKETNPVNREVEFSEIFLNISVETDSPRFVTKVLEQQSLLCHVRGTAPTVRPDASPLDPLTQQPIASVFTSEGDDGLELQDAQISDLSLKSEERGIWALEKVDLFNLLCIPPLTRETDIGLTTLSEALAYCKERRAMLIVDPPFNWERTSNVTDPAIGIDGPTMSCLRDENAAIYFPRLKIPDPLKENSVEEFAPCGAVAGIFALTDSQQGVWKAPAGKEATLSGVPELSCILSDDENEQLNPLGVNCLRTFPALGNVVWGARTLEGAESLASEWKYVPVRRLAYYIEESIFRGTKWVIFEPNDAPLWNQIRLNVGVFMHNQFRQGAFQGATDQEAYFVKCGNETTALGDIDIGIVNIEVGFAPLKPAEFVIIKIRQIAGQTQT